MWVSKCKTVHNLGVFGNEQLILTDLKRNDISIILIIFLEFNIVLPPSYEIL